MAYQDDARQLLGMVLDRLRHYLQTVRALLTGPTEFFRRYFKSDAFNGDSGDGKGDGDTVPFMKPFAFLGIGITFAALIGPIYRAALLDMARNNPQSFPDFVTPESFDELQRQFEMSCAERAARVGQTCIDFQALTGLPIIDGILGELVHVGVYLVFAMLVSALAKGQLPSKPVAHCFAYVAGIIIAFLALAELGTSLLYAVTGAGIQLFLMAGFVSEFAALAYLVALPTVVLSNIFTLEKGVVLRAVGIALVIVFFVKFFLELVLPLTGLRLENLGLGILGLF